MTSYVLFVGVIVSLHGATAGGITDDRFFRANKIVSSATSYVYEKCSLVRCSALCMSNENCGAYRRNGSCEIFINVGSMTTNLLSNIYIRRSFFVRLLIEAGFAEYKGNRFVKTTTSSSMTWDESLADCRRDFPEAMLFIPRSTQDVQFMISEHKRVAGNPNAGDEFWIGLNDADDESASGIGTWKWIDGTVVNNLYGMQVNTGGSADTDSNDYVSYYLKSNVVVGLKFFDNDYDAKGYMCEITVE